MHSFRLKPLEELDQFGHLLKPDPGSDEGRQVGVLLPGCSRDRDLSLMQSSLDGQIVFLGDTCQHFA